MCIYILMPFKSKYCIIIFQFSFIVIPTSLWNWLNCPVFRKYFCFIVWFLHSLLLFFVILLIVCQYHNINWVLEGLWWNTSECVALVSTPAVTVYSPGCCSCRCTGAEPVHPRCPRLVPTWEMQRYHHQLKPGQNSFMFKKQKKIDNWG